MTQFISWGFEGRMKNNSSTVITSASVFAFDGLSGRGINRKVFDKF